MLTGTLPVSAIEKERFSGKRIKFHCLTGKTPVSIEDFFQIFHALTGKVPVSNTK